jgi:hypothetical protein
MKVRELIEQLHQLDPEMLVVIDGYEGGADEPKSVTVVRIALNYNTGSLYYGKHEFVSVGVDENEIFSAGGAIIDTDQYTIVTAVNIWRP